MIKKTLFFIVMVVGPLFSQAQQNQLTRIDTGRIDGARYRIIIPQNWNHNLVMYAHGYEPLIMPYDPKSFHSDQNDVAIKPFLDRGFAVARSAYSKRGWAHAEGVEETEALRKYFLGKYGKPDSCFITGHSMGGGITLAIIENFPQVYQAAMPMCPLSNHPYLQVKQGFDINAVFGVLFPGVLPSMADLAKGNLPMVAFPAVQKAIAADTVLAAAFAQKYELKLSDLPLVIVFNQAVLTDIFQLAGGNPFDNRNTLYSGFPDNLKVNEKVERLGPDPGVRDVFSAYDKTGHLERPTLLLHTLYDQLIPASMAVIPYDNMVHENHDTENLVMVYTNGQGHCQFTAEETGKAFDLLRKWAKTGKRPVPGRI